jgi:thiosulfate/3-mercaptopyruvate sulfurtransferase
MYTSIIEAELLDQHLDDPNWIVFDCRYNSFDKEAGFNQYLESHIPGARYAHMDKDLSGPIIPGQTGRHPFPDEGVFTNQLRQWGVNQSSQVVVYDASHGALASRLWFMLRYLGHDKVAILNGGFNNWTKQKFPITADLPNIEQGNFESNIQTELVASLSSVVEISKKNDACLIDSRAANRYRGETEPLDPIAGHIPNAENYPFAENVNSDGMWKSKEEIKDRFKNLRQEKEMIFYCGSGVTACHNLLALHYAEIADAKLYPGSWSEWIVDPKRPIG